MYENEGKRSGAYSAGSYVHPYVLLNYKNNLDSEFTLAHEMGHALHSYFSNTTQAPIYSQYVIFVAEVASTCNEALLMQYLLKKTTDSKERAALINYFLEQFKGRCFINIDKFWSNPEKIYKAVKRHNMQQQILVKSKLSKNVVDCMKNKTPGLQFMPIVKGEHPEHEMLLDSGINYVGVEVLFEKDSDMVAGESFIEKMHRDNILVWVNSIIFDHKVQLAAGHSDDTALTVSEDDGWGFLADRGFDIIQTDWPGMLIDYLKRTDKYYR